MSDQTDNIPAGFARAERGFLPALEEVARTAGAGWRSAAAMLRWLAAPDAVTRPDLAASARGPGWVEALAIDARARALTHDWDGVRACADLLQDAESARGRRWAALARGWCLAANGDGDAAFALSEESAAGARESGSAVQVVEAALLRGAARMVDGDLSGALSDTRRAARMAQTEHLWMSHLTASLLLARLRRLTGRPSLASLVAGAARAASPRVWWGALDWELALAGAEQSERDVRCTFASEHAADSCHRLLRGGLGASELARFRGEVASCAWVRSDLDAVVAAMGLDVALDDDVRAWIGGRAQSTPAALHGLLSPVWSSDAPGALVVAAPGRAGRRLLVLAVGDAMPRVSAGGGRAARPEAVAAALLLAGPDGALRGELFARSYGFAYRPPIHEPSFKVARHEAKKLLDGFAEVWLDGDRVRVEVQRPFAISDPRCRPTLETTVLQHLAADGRASAKALAARLGVSIRTVQNALRTMTDEGVCRLDREGRRVAYVLEDTTFCEVTVG